MRLTFTFLLLTIVGSVFANTGRFRLTLRGNPSNSIVIGWDQVSGSNPVVYYGTVDQGTNWSAYQSGKSPDRVVSYRGMNNHFARLTNLQADTYYYFVIRDSQGTSQRFYFRTAPDNSSRRLSFIAGGDSRNNRTPRQNANRLVAKLKPNAVLFGGDMTDNDTNSQWINWFNDWQLTISQDGRMYPIVATRGNHEGSNSTIYNLFDTPSSNAYYALTFGGDLIRTYTLNTEMSITGNQTSWLSNDLQSNGSNVIWKAAQYHKPMRPHVSSKSEGNNQYNSWAGLFHNHGVKLVVECDAHTVKTTWPVRPSTGSGSDEGFIRDDQNGTVYVGEGCWGAPLRSNNDAKNWTRNSGQFNQFKWIFVDQSKIEVRTVKVDNASSVGEVSNSNPFAIPSNLDLWSPSNGSVVTINNANVTPPVVSLTAPANNAYFTSPQSVTLSANASDADGSIARVDFKVNGSLAGSDNSAPYGISYNLPADGVYSIVAEAYDNEGNSTASSPRSVSVGNITEILYKRIASGNDDVEENANGSMYTNSSDLELVADGSRGNQTVGLRFTNLAIPQGATINRAYVQFTVDETNTGTTNLLIRGHDTNNASAFTSASNNVSGRTKTSASVTWNPSGWTTVGQSGSSQRTPEIKSIVQEIVNRSGWTSGNNMVLILTGTGERTAEAYEGSSSSAPLLHVEYSIGGSQANQSPNVSVTSPVAGQVFSSLNAINITASASDADGSISEVEFFINNSSIGKDLVAPYGISWTPKSAGNYSLTARAKDNNGAIATSSVISFVVNTSTSCAANFPDIETFEGTSDWQNVTGDDLNWTLRSGGTPSNNTGPSGAAEGSQYMYVEASSPNYPSKTALLESICYDLRSVTSPVVSFSYHMLGGNMGSLALEASENGGAWTGIWSRSGSQGSNWLNATVNLTGFGSSDNVRLRFKATTGSGWQSDICIDNVQVRQGGSTPVTQTFSRRITTGNDDVEEDQNGGMYMNSSDLELVYDGSTRGNQAIGLRFRNITIPQGAIIQEAYVQFTVDETANSSGSKTIFGHDTNNSGAFTTASYNVTDRTKTSAQVSWNPSGWTSVGAAGQAQRTPQLVNIVQEIVNRSGWTSGSSLSLIITGSGRRTAESYNGSASNAPLLVVKYTDDSSLSGRQAFENASEENLVTGTDIPEIFPNPVSDQVNVTVIEGWENAGISILTVDGKTLISSEMNGKTAKVINVRDLPKGLYIVLIKSEKGSFTQRIIKE